MKVLLSTLIFFAAFGLQGREKCKSENFRIVLPLEKTASAVKPLQNMTRDSLVLLLTAFSSSSPSANDEYIDIPCESVLPEARPVFQSMSQEESYLRAYALLKQFLKTGAYHRAQPLTHSNFHLPPTVKELESQLRFSSWPLEVIDSSQVKGLMRILYRSPIGYPETSIAVTKDEKGRVRETEIILKRTDRSGDYDFYAYGKDGKPAFHSTFLSKNKKEVIGPVPHTCLSCHYDGISRKFQTIPSSFHP